MKNSPHLRTQEQLGILRIVEGYLQEHLAPFYSRDDNRLESVQSCSSGNRMRTARPQPNEFTRSAILIAEVRTSAP